MRLACPLLLVCVLLTAGCRESPAAPSDLPSWLTTLIRQIEAQPVANPPASIAAYEFRGETVYYLSARCCDIPSTLYRGDGSVMCHPDGGLTGKGDGACPSFVFERTKERMVWRDSRRTS